MSRVDVCVCVEHRGVFGGDRQLERPVGETGEERSASFLQATTTPSRSAAVSKRHQEALLS